MPIMGKMKNADLPVAAAKQCDSARGKESPKPLEITESSSELAKHAVWPPVEWGSVELVINDV